MLNSTIPGILAVPKAETTPASYSSFFENSPTPFALLDPKKGKILFANAAFSEVLEFKLIKPGERFPNPVKMKVRVPNFLHQWNRQLFIVENKGQSNFEWEMESDLGTKKNLKAEIWRIVLSDKTYFGLKVEDITLTKKLLRDSKHYVRIF